MRLDEYLISRHIARDLGHAEGLILTGDVLVNDQPVNQAGFSVKESDVIRLRNTKQWVARSAQKLSSALDSFGIDVKDKVCLDVGASTGGFTQVLLSRGARKVIALDVAYGIIHSSLRNHPSVVLMERSHICKVSMDDFIERPDFFVVDVSFISLRTVCLCLKKLFSPWEGVVLFKPQFEVSKDHLRQGIVVDENVLQDSISSFKAFLKDQSIEFSDFVSSPLKGKKGNQEFLLKIYWKK